MGNLETKAALGYDIVQRQANGNKKNKTLKIKDVFMHSINYEVNKIKKAQEKPTWKHKYCFRERNDLFIK